MFLQLYFVNSAPICTDFQPFPEWETGYFPVMPLSRMAVGCNSINFTTLSMVYFVRKCAIYEYEYSYTVIWGSIAWFVCGYGIALHVIKKKKNLLFVILKMASNVTQDSPSTTCKKCSKLYTDPRILPCLHSFCKNCIKSLLIQRGSKICCPSCKTTSPIPKKGVEAIPQNAQLSYEAKVAMWKSRRKLLVSVVSAVGSHHNRS